MKRRYVFTPDEMVEMAETCYKVVVGAFEKKPVEAEGKAGRQVPTLLPKPERPTPGPKGITVTVSQLRKAQKAERKRQRFNKTVKKAATVMAKALQKALKAQVKAAIAVQKTCNKLYKAAEAAKAKAKAQADAALAAMRKARKAAEELRKRLQAARTWLTAERRRQRHLDQLSKDRVARAIAWGIVPTPDFEDFED